MVAVFSTTIFLHRSATHKSLELHPAIALIRLLIVMKLAQPYTTIQEIATER